MAGTDPRPRTHRTLPDPAVWLAPSDPAWPAVIRIGLRAALLLAGVLLVAFSGRAILARARHARDAATAAVAAVAAGGELADPAAGAPAKPKAPEVSPAELAELQKSWIGSESIAPRGERVEAGTGERVRAFEGFGLQIDGPAGARVLVDGEDRGTAPLLTTVACKPGDRVAVLLERGAQRASATTRCRADTLVQLELRFAAARPGR